MEVIFNKNKKKNMKNKTKLMLGDNIESLKKLPANSIDSVVTDGPYGLTFMNKKWDYDVPSVEFWKEVYRVLKPGGHVLSFGGTRTYHRMVVNIEDAGFEIRDQIMWIYGSGFPKSLNVGKAVDKLNGSEREVVGKDICGTREEQIGEWGMKQGEYYITKGTSEWEGFGTALKPANEPICLARKPLSEKSVAENVLKWRTGGINVDGCRVGSETKTNSNGKKSMYGGNSLFESKTHNLETISHDYGRFPANIIFECICDEVIKGEKGEMYVRRKVSGFRADFIGGGDVLNSGSLMGNYTDKGDIHTNPDCPCRLLDEQSGGASRFFYQAKVSKAERNMGLEGFEEVEINFTPGFGSRDDDGNIIKSDGSLMKPILRKNTHPTVKPINLMTYLCRLITPPNGIILDPFMGSGSTGVAAQLEGFRFVGMEMDSEYFKIAEARIENFEKYTKFTKK
jgi:site-specific DNA-methyltransferase (adenine-specific)